VAHGGSLRRRVTGAVRELNGIGKPNCTIYYRG
jgi:hypothetical protein